MEGTDDWAGSILCTSGHLTRNLFSFIILCVCVVCAHHHHLFYSFFGWHSVTATLHINHMNIVVPANNITRVGLLLRCSIINTQQQTKRSTHFLMSIKKQKSDFCLTLATTSIWKAMNDSQHGNKICIKKKQVGFNL